MVKQIDGKMVKKGNKIKNPLHQALQIFEKTTKSPIDYLKEQKEFAEKNRLLLKSLFDYAKKSGSHFNSNSLPDEIFVEHDIDEEQIWQQLEMQNDSFWEKCMTETCRLLSLNENKLILKAKYAEQEQVEESTEENENALSYDEVSDGEGNTQANHYLEKSDDEGDDEDDQKASDDVENDEDDSDVDQKDKFKVSKNKATSIVDDQFFNLSEMEAFLDSEDKKELDRLNGRHNATGQKDSEDEIDYFDSLSSSEGSDDEDGQKEKNIMFADFFDEDDQLVETSEQIRHRKRTERDAKNLRKKQQMKEDLGLDDSEAENSERGEDEGEYHSGSDENEDDDQVEKSEYDLRQQRLKKRIEELEEKALAEKPWQLKGEITSTTRPKNSLLEEVLEFDSVARPPPLITEETTLCLEDIIKRRIKSKAWDDVERKIKPINDQQDFRKNLVLPQEKSKESLAQIYEKEYLEKVQKLNNVDDTSKPNEPAEYIEIRRAMKDLFVKLDALSNFHFTSKPVAAEAKIITNIPAIEMEEVAPVAVSDATLLAPEEIAKPGDEIGKTERTTTDKKRERRKKKLKQKIIKQRNEKQVEEKEKLGIKVTSKEKEQHLMNQVVKSRNVIKGKNTAIEENKALKSSKTFFTQLQDNITGKVKKSLGKKKLTTDFSKEELNAKRLKL